MRCKHIFLWLALAASLFAVSCKKEEEEELDEYLYGSVYFSIPQFLSAGQTVTLSPTGVRRADGGGLGYAWEVTPTAQLDTSRFEKDPASKKPDWTYTIPDTLVTLQIKVTAFAAGYYTSSCTQETVVVDAENSVRGLDFSGADGIFADPRDGKEYPYVTHGGRDWFARNLAYEGAGQPYDYCPAVKDIFGMYYTWGEASAACPEGWRLPTEADWVALASGFRPDAGFQPQETFTDVAGALMGNARFNEEEEPLWEYWPSVKITNDAKLYILPYGYAAAGHGGKYGFTGFREFAVFWTADEYDAEMAIYRYFYQDKTGVYANAGFKEDFLASVRCVRDSQ